MYPPHTYTIPHPQRLNLRDLVEKTLDRRGWDAGRGTTFGPDDIFDPYL